MLDLLCWVINWPIMRRLLRSRRLDPDSVIYSPSIAHSKRWEKFSEGFYEGYLNAFAIDPDSAGVVSRPMIKSGGDE